MSEFDPAELLKRIRSKTPTRPLPELPKRPQDPSFQHKVSELEANISTLQEQLRISKQAENETKQENERLHQQIQTLERKNKEIHQTFVERIEKLESMLERSKHSSAIRPEQERPQRDHSSENRPKTPPPRSEIKKPAFSSAVSSNSTRYAPNKQKGYLDLTPLVQLYKVMPDFPRPVLKIEFNCIR